jgi:hypothetical protein
MGRRSRLEDHPRRRSGARIEQYRGTLPLPDDAFLVVQSLLVRANENLEGIRFPDADAEDAATKIAALMGRLCTMTLEELASDNCGELG